MLHLFYSLPDLLILALVVAVVLSIVLVAPLLGRHVLRLTVDEARDDAAFDAYKALLAMVGFVLAFSLVQVDANLRNIQGLEGREATLLGNVDRVLLRIGIPGGQEARPLVAAYGRSFVRDEWPLLTDGHRSPVTDARYSDLSRAVRALEPQGMRQEAMYMELLRALDDLSDVREELIHDSEISLPTFFWVTTGCFLGMAFVLALFTRPSWTRAAGLGGTAAGVGLLMAFVMISDHPFRGQSSVSPVDVVQALHLNSRRI